LPDVNKQLWDGTGDAPASGISNWADKYKIINPDQFNQTLCVKEQLWCASHALTALVKDSKPAKGEKPPNPAVSVRIGASAVTFLTVLNSITLILTIARVK
jgi:hypothetical protein